MRKKTEIVKVNAESRNTWAEEGVSYTLPISHEEFLKEGE